MKGMRELRSVVNDLHTTTIVIRNRVSDIAEAFAQQLLQVKAEKTKLKSVRDAERRESKTAAYHRVTQEATPGVMSFFNESLLAKAKLIQAVDEQNTFVGKDSATGKAMIDLFDTLILLLSSKKKKAAYNDADGKRASAYSKKMQRALHLARNEGKLRKHPGKDRNKREMRLRLRECGNGVYFIREEDIEAARIRMEKALQGSAPYHRGAKMGRDAMMLRSDL